jgi:hypothetical protein
MLFTLGTEGPSRLESNGSGAQLRLGGKLRVELLPGTDPAIGQTWDIITASNRQGEFAELILPALGAGKRLAVGYATGRVTLSVVAQ